MSLELEAEEKQPLTTKDTSTTLLKPTNLRRGSIPFSLSAINLLDHRSRQISQSLSKHEKQDTLTSINKQHSPYSTLSDYELEQLSVEIYSISKSQYIKTDLYLNLIIVSIPAIFSNLFWRIMNLYNVAVSKSYKSVIWETTYSIAPVVFLTAFIYDMFRQIFEVKPNNENEKLTVFDKVNTYYSSFGLRKSLHLGLKFFSGWTIGYELIAKRHQVYSDRSSKSIFLHALGAGVGSWIGLTIMSELIEIFEYYLNINNKYSMTKNFINLNHRGALGVGIKGFFEGFVWSIIGDLDIYKHMYNNTSSSKGSSKFVDSLTLGLFSGISFSIGGLITSYLGYYWLLYKKLNE